jgi:DnaJ-class molecular chaperone
MIEIKPGTQAGAEIRLRGKGVPHLRRPGSRGDVRVMVDVRVPNKLSAKQRELLEQLSVELGDEAAVEEAEAEAAAATEGTPKRRSKSRRRGQSTGLRDRLRDAIS